WCWLIRICRRTCSPDGPCDARRSVARSAIARRGRVWGSCRAAIRWTVTIRSGPRRFRSRPFAHTTSKERPDDTRAGFLSLTRLPPTYFCGAGGGARDEEERRLHRSARRRCREERTWASSGARSDRRLRVLRENAESALLVQEARSETRSRHRI